MQAYFDFSLWMGVACIHIIFMEFPFSGLDSLHMNMRDVEIMHTLHRRGSASTVIMQVYLPYKKHVRYRQQT